VRPPHEQGGGLFDQNSLDHGQAIVREGAKNN
jgi:hypothetical protein